MMMKEASHASYVSFMRYAGLVDRRTRARDRLGRFHKALDSHLGAGLKVQRDGQIRR